MTRVFVYGTLLSGLGNHGILSTSAFVRASRSEPRFTMVDLGAFPGIVEGGSTAIVGELYDVGHATLARLDRLEGHPRFYERKTIALDDGSAVAAYVLPPHYVGEREAIVSGDWRAHLERLHDEDDGAFELEEDFTEGEKRNLASKGER